MSVRKVILIAVAVNLAFVAALGGLFWSLSARAQAGGQPQRQTSDVSGTAEVLNIVSESMNYQGVLRDDTGKPVEGTHNLTFTLYACFGILPACTAEWSDTYPLDLVDGLFNVRLGPLDPALFEPRVLPAGWDLEIGVRMDGGTELTPRVKLDSTVPWAFTSIYSMYAESMPEPDYDSGWQTDVACVYPVLTHNLGGDIDDYVVELECRDPDYGTYNCIRTWGTDAFWSELTDTSVRVNSCGAIHSESFRLRIWVTR